MHTGRLRILFVHEVNWRQKVVYEIHDYPELLSKRGHECVFIDFAEGERPVGLRGLLDFRLRTRPNQWRAHTGGCVEVRTPGRVLPPPADRLCASLTQVPCIYRALRYECFDAMVLYAVPTNGWQAAALARHFRVPVLFRAIDVSHALRRTVFSALIKGAERAVTRRADWISCNNEALRDYLIAGGADPGRMSVDYPGIDLVRFAPGDRPARLCAKYGILPSHRTVMFMGTLYRFAGLDWFIEEFASHLRQHPDVRLLLFGGGEEQESLRMRCDRLGVSASVVAPGFVPYDELADHIRLADVAINPFTPSLVTHCALPGKMLQYMACGVPSVCTPLRGMMGMVRDGGGIIYREPGHAFVDAVRGLLDDPRARTATADAARACMERICTWDRAVDRLEAAIRAAIAARCSMPPARCRR
jgi:glycosyltransferase involved in cell wall biosynthesis